MHGFKVFFNAVFALVMVAMLAGCGGEETMSERTPASPDSIPDIVAELELPPVKPEPMKSDDFADAVADEMESEIAPGAGVEIGELAQKKAQARAKAVARRSAKESSEVVSRSKPKLREFELNDAEKDGFHKVRVFYGTNRNQTGELKANDVYGTSRGSMTYGLTEVSIPLTHKTGALEAPKWWKMEFSENPTKHVVLQKVETLSWKELSAKLNETLAHSSGKNAFIFVHGYNVAFKDAARRTAQIHHDLNFDGAPIFFSWPSQGQITLTSYTHDETNAKWSYPYLKNFLVRIATETQADNIYLVAHSMGTRVLSNAVASIMNERPDLKKRFKEIILAAPDIDADVFVNDLAPKLVEASRNTTLYAASDDRALMTSREVHGGYPRAGDAGNNLIILKGIDTIDATGVDASLLRHSYFAEASSILKDIKEILSLAKPAKERSSLELRRRASDGLEFFRVKK